MKDRRVNRGVDRVNWRFIVLIVDTYQLMGAHGSLFQSVVSVHAAGHVFS